VTTFTCPGCGAEFPAQSPGGGDVRCPSCGKPFPDPEATVADETGPLAAGGVAPGKELGGFRVEERIGSGAMGEVYKATQLSLDRTVALKVLPSAFSERPAFVRRFHEESSALSALNHPNIVTIHERGNVGNIYFFVMEHVDGPSLQEFLSEPLEVEQFIRVAKGVASALDYAHSRGIVHRDIKPSNLMVNSAFEVKIADFGLAGLMEQERRAAEGGAQRPRRMGTPAYMSPEQRADPLSVDGRTDIYAAGVVFYELVAGCRPKQPVTEAPSEVNERADPRLDPIVAKCLQEEPADRYQSAAEMLAALEQFESEWARAPRCPECGRVGPVRSQRCVHCNHDLDQFFDLCPECKHKNRRDVRRCLNCGVDLEKGRTLVTNRIAIMLDQADRLRLSGSYDESLQMLKEVRSVEGRAFENERHRAQVLSEKVRVERRERGLKAYEDARRLAGERRFREALDLFRSIPADVKDTRAAIRATLQLQAKIAAERKAAATTNLILLAVAIIIMVVVLLAVVRF
jgi:hypothetical protein